MKDKIKTTSFWLGISGAIVIIIDSIGELFGFKVASQEIGDVVVSVCSILVLLGIVSKKNPNDIEDSTQEELLLELKNNNSDSEENLD